MARLTGDLETDIELTRQMIKNYKRGNCPWTDEMIRGLETQRWQRNPEQIAYVNMLMDTVLGIVPEKQLMLFEEG